jgi:hypothetical protein
MRTATLTVAFEVIYDDRLTVADIRGDLARTIGHFEPQENAPYRLGEAGWWTERAYVDSAKDYGPHSDESVEAGGA